MDTSHKKLSFSLLVLATPFKYNFPMCGDTKIYTPTAQFSCQYPLICHLIDPLHNLCFLVRGCCIIIRLFVKLHNEILIVAIPTQSLKSKKLINVVVSPSPSPSSSVSPPTNPLTFNLMVHTLPGG